MTINLDLSQQEYKVFDIDKEPTTLELKNKNFIFGRNGSGKSTICKMITNQFSKDYDVHIFTGFNNLVKDEKLNAIVLGEENINVKKDLNPIKTKLIQLETTIKKKEIELKSLEWQESYLEEGIEKHKLYINKEKALSNYEKQKNEIDKFHIKKAQELKKHKKPRITKISYDKNDFLNDISINKILDESEKNEYENILNETSRNKILKEYKINNIDIVELTNEVNRILKDQVQERVIIEELKDDPRRKEFAKQGLEIHEIGEKCSFCGNEISGQRIKELQSFISVSELKKINDEISNQLSIIKEQIEIVNEIKKLEKASFYTLFHKDIDEINDDIEIKKKKHIDLLNFLSNSLNEKKNNIFEKTEAICIETPDEFAIFEKTIEEIINKHNELAENIGVKQKNARKELRLHHVALKWKEKESYKKTWRGYEIEIHELENLKDALKTNKNNVINASIEIKGLKENPEKNTIYYLEKEMSNMKIQKKDILKKTKSTYKLVEIVNNKLKNSGKRNLELTLQKDENEIEHYQIKDEEDVRPIDRLSTGEKNIISFLYFLETLNDIEKQSDKNKIVVFDDPMNSNDDSMQYLIITEIQKLYRNMYPKKFNTGKDYFVCLTHNAHFYLNIQPQGNFKERKLVKDKLVEISKYDKNYFYRLENGRIERITSYKDDFNTHYECLWIELQSLYENDLLNSMLNSMRRIIETYIKFNKMSPDKFYENKEEHKKLFDVNSHSIDDHSIEVIGKDKEELIAMFKLLFESNNAIEHFKMHWK